MNKQAISVTLEVENLLWLQAQTRAQRRRSVSEMLDNLIRQARTKNKNQTSLHRSIVGTMRLVDSDSNLDTADIAVRAFFSTALERQTTIAHGRVAQPKRRRAHVARKARQRG